MKKVILFGGSFDPVHYGHLEIAKNALKQLKADELWFILAAVSPFKEENTSFEHRKKMLEIILKDQSKLKISEIENLLPKPSYSIDTVKALKKESPNTKFYWLIGSDQIKSLHKWKDFNTLNKLVEFIVYDRPNYQSTHSYKLIKGTSYNISSTDIRNGNSFDTDSKILEYMMIHGLYLNTLLKHKLSDYRYKHTLRVTELALDIAKHHKLDLNKVRLSAMFHDYCKEDKDLKDLIQKEYPNKYHHPQAFYHAYAAKHVLEHKYHIKNKDVLEAIENHVDGASSNPYAMCLYIADKCEPGRNFDSSEIIKISKQNLTEGFNKIKQINKEYLRSKNEIS